MKKLLTIILTLLTFMSPCIAQWEWHAIDTLGSYCSTVVAKDIDQDGDNDLLVTSWDKVLLYVSENEQWTRDTIDSDLSGALGVDIADFDQDGNPDVLASAEFTDVVVWYKNVGGEHGEWLKDTIAVIDYPGVTWATDINGDGAADVAVNSFNSGEMFWYENNLPAGWIQHFIGSRMGFGNFSVTDINADGKPDIIGATTNPNNVVLYRNNFPDMNWTEVIIDDDIANSFNACAGDIDNDGDMDVAATDLNAAAGNADVIWYENDGTEMTWTRHPVCTDMVNARFVDMADVDNDELSDLIVVDKNANEIILFINEDGGQNWTKQIIDDNYSEPNAIWFNDVDLDGDFDITPTKQSADILLWYENHAPGTAFPETLDLSPFAIELTDDNLTVTSSVYNPESHPISVFAAIEGEQTQYRDTLFLFNDGQHQDGELNDSIWANSKPTSEMPEDSYLVELIVSDSAFSSSFIYHPLGRFIKFGPLVWDGFEFHSSDDTLFYPGCRISIKPRLINNSEAASATGISVRLIGLDERIQISDFIRSFESIPAGESSTATYQIPISISEGCQANIQLPVLAEIYAYDQVCWTDTFSIYVHEASDMIESDNRSYFRIYPNPASDQITVMYNQVNTTQASVMLFDISGKKVLADIIQPGSQRHTINLSSLNKGLYLIRIRNNQNSVTEKVIKIE